MNVKLRAALEVSGILLGSIAVMTLVQYILRAASAAYGAEAVINGITFGVMSIAAYVIVGLLYDQRVARLQYRDKLNEIVNK